MLLDRLKAPELKREEMYYCSVTVPVLMILTLPLSLSFFTQLVDSHSGPDQPSVRPPAEERNYMVPALLLGVNEVSRTFTVCLDPLETAVDIL